jgi:hypothetical protein
VQFFLNWIHAAEARRRAAPPVRTAEQKEQLAEQERARTFFNDLLADANDE